MRTKPVRTRRASISNWLNGWRMRARSAASVSRLSAPTRVRPTPSTRHSDEELAVSTQITEFERTLAFFDGAEIVATAGIFSYQMTLPGGTLPCGGVARISVQSTHRRRGLLTAMMRRQLDDMHERGEPLAALYASEAPIYGRFG